ncbi:MAG: PD-(D/E)XK nuclease family protein [Alphaproteobacteria bacterium]|nr:PD-(D/E)XK nuclease family protein [Alphaproteobacteria bacterium]
MSPRPPDLRLFPTALSAERALLAHVDQLAAGDSFGAGPVRVVVPGSSQRLHLLRAFAAHRGATLGLRIQTLSGLAAEVLRAAGERPGHADPLLPVLVARHGRLQPALAEVLDGLDDGWQAAVPAVVALLDAGFVADRDAVPLARKIGAMDDGSTGEAERLRWIALVAVAGGVQRDLARLRLRRGADSLRAAATRLALRAEELLPARACCFFGSTDLSAAELDLVDALVRHRRTGLFVVAPPPLDRLARGDASAHLDAAGVLRLRERLATAARLRLDGERASPVDLGRRRAVGQSGEARDLARGLRQALDQGVVAERIGVVVRDPAAWAALLRPELDRLGIPFSGVGASAPAGPALRRLRALTGLLRDGPDAPTDLWLSALGRLAAAPAIPLADLRTGLGALGCATLGQVAALDPDARLGGAAALSLPVRTGLTAVVDGAGDGSGDPPEPDGPADEPDDGDAGGPAAGDRAGALPRRRLPAFGLAAAVAAARTLLAMWTDDAPRPLHAHAELVRRISEQALGWGAPEPAWRAMDAAVRGLSQRLDAALELTRAEALMLLSPAVESAALGPVGGDGGGVQLLSAIEARGRTFERLFVGGLVRGELPRSPRPDPLLPDGIRRTLQDLLPDLALDGDRRAAEAELVAHLLGAAPMVRLSWAGVDDLGKALAPSPAVERLALALGEGGVVVLPPVGGAADVDGPFAGQPRPADEHLRAAADRPVPDLDAALALALDTGDLRVGVARLAARDELDRPPGQAGPGPLLGLVGPVGAQADPRSGALFVTTLEAVSRCAWQTFLRRVLRLEPAPDAAGALPEADARLVGMVVHAVLETVCQGPDPASGQGPGLLAQPWRPVWPDAPRLDVLLEAAARRVAADEGLGLDGMWRVLAARARPFLDVAHRVEWSDGVGPPVVAVEHQAQATVDGPDGPLPLWFRADRVDRDPDGHLRFTDYKTGGPVSRGRKPDTRARHLARDLAAGRRLQGALYAQAAPDAEGRYLSLAPDLGDLGDEVRDARVPDDAGGLPEAGWRRALGDVVGVTHRVWRAGAFLPRLTTPDGARVADVCKHCDVRQACAQGDSGARRRLSSWARSDQGADLDRAARAWWWLGEEPT